MLKHNCSWHFMPSMTQRQKAQDTWRTLCYLQLSNNNRGSWLGIKAQSNSTEKDVWTTCSGPRPFSQHHLYDTYSLYQQRKTGCILKSSWELSLNQSLIKLGQLSTMIRTLVRPSSSWSYHLQPHLMHSGAFEYITMRFLRTTVILSIISKQKSHANENRKCCILEQNHRYPYFKIKLNSKGELALEMLGEVFLLLFHSQS